MRLPAGIAASLILIAATSARAQFGLPGTKGAEPSAVKSEIFADTAAIAAGKPFTLAVALSTGGDYHIYWSNPGESGFATKVKLTLPAGFKSEPLALPLPKKFIQPGDIYGYGYAGRTLFLFKITPPETLSGTTFPISAAASWLSCNKAECVPGDAKLNLALTAGTPSPANAELFASAREALPLAKEPDGITIKDSVPAVDNKNATFKVELTFKEAPTSLEVFPDNVDGLAVTAVKSELDKQNVNINITSHVMGGQQLPIDKLPLLIVYTAADGKRRGFFHPISLAVLGAHPKE